VACACSPYTVRTTVRWGPGSFQIRQTFLNRPAPNRFDDIGRWRIESDTSRWGISVRELGDVPDAPGRSLGLGFGGWGSRGSNPAQANYEFAAFTRLLDPPGPWPVPKYPRLGLPAAPLRRTATAAVLAEAAAESRRQIAGAQRHW